jgi:RNA polymerase sigma-70 factor (ECF subfamily)
MLVRQYQGAVYRMCLSVLNHPSDAEDAVQETFIAALRSLKAFRGQSTFRTWIFAIALNVCRRQYKRRIRNQALHSSLKLVQPMMSEAPPDPEQTVIRSEVVQALERAISELDEKHRLPVVLRYYHELSISEIARILNITEGTVHSRLFNARERMRSHMSVRNTLFKVREGIRQ